MDKASWGWGPNTENSEEIPWTKQVGVEAPTENFEEIPRTKQVGVGEKTGDNEFYPSLAFILIREFYKVDKRDNYRQC